MNDTLLGALIGAGATLLGVIFTGGIAWAQGRARAQRERANVRLLVQLENDRNLKALAAFWTEVQSVEHPGSGPGYGDEELAYLKRRKLAGTFLAPWGHLMWESHATQVASALSHDEIEQTYALHTALDMFSTRRAEVQAELAKPENAELWRQYHIWRDQARRALSRSETVPTFSQGSTMVAFNERTAAIWTACDESADVLMARDNPVQAGATPGRRRLAHHLVERITGFVRRH